MSYIYNNGFSMERSLLTGFIHYLRFEKRYSQHTITAYQKDLEQFCDYLQKEYNLDDISAANHFQVRSWLATFREQEMQPRSINRKIASLNSFYKHLMRQGTIDKNPAGMVHAQKLPTRLPSFLKEPEIAKLLDGDKNADGEHKVEFPTDFSGTTDRLICELLYATGMRRNELLQLRENDVEWGMKQIRVLGKGNKERLIPVNASLLDDIRHYIALKKDKGIYGGEHLLCLPDGSPLYAMYVYRTVKKYLSSITTLKKRSPHVLRHTFATHLLNNGANIQAIKDLLGHASLAATQVYTHNSIDRLKDIHKHNHPRG